MKMKVLTFLLTPALLACAAQAGPLSRGEAIEISRRYIEKNYPMYHLELFAVTATDQGNTWVVSYLPPEDAAGGSARIEVNKRTRAVTVLELGQ
jgi:hypothetical protein